jgi:arylsulfatase A-like enzyme
MIAAIRWTLVLLAVLPLAAAAQPPADVRKPNVLLILSDDQRADSIGAYGNRVVETPHLDRLAREGVVFTRAICPNPICVASRLELLTGCCGLRHAEQNFIGRPTANQLLLPEALRRAGYATWHVGKWHVDGQPSARGYQESRGLFAGGKDSAVSGVDYFGRPATGYAGWKFRGEPASHESAGLTSDISRRIADATIELIERRSTTPFFLHVNFTAPHDPLLLPPEPARRYEPDRMPLWPNFLPEHPFDHGNRLGRDEQLFAHPRTEAEVRREIAAYLAVVTEMDRQIDRILAALETTGQLSNTIIIFASDQGIGLGSHGLRGKQNMYEHTISVPLIVRLPQGPRGRHCQAQCYLRDLYPTICELTQVAAPAGLDAHSLVPLLRGEATTLYPEVFGCFTDTQRMIRTERWKLIYYPKLPRFQLFDLEHDPHELRDLAGSTEVAEAPEALKKLTDQLAAWQIEMGDHIPLATRPVFPPGVPRSSGD